MTERIPHTLLPFHKAGALLASFHVASHKRGTFAIMGDGQVRFISPANKVTPDIFRALCTIAGGETISNLDRLCPLVPLPEGEVLLASEETRGHSTVAMPKFWKTQVQEFLLTVPRRTM